MNTGKFLSALAVLLLAVTLIGCVSSGGGTEKSAREAARVNTQLADAYLRRGDVELAMEKIDRALDQDSGFPEAHLVKGMILARAEEFRDADRHYLRAARLGRDNPTVRNNVAAYLCERGRHRDGEELFLEVARMPTYGRAAVAHANAGMCAKRIPALDRAETHLRRALELEPNYAPALWHLAELSYQKEDHLSARAFLQRLEGVQRLGPDGLWLGVRIERKLGDAAAERRYADLLLRDYGESPEAELLTGDAESSGESK